MLHAKKSILYRVNRSIRRWNEHIEESIGVKLEPHFLIVIATILILLVQIGLFVLFTSQSIYCHLPSLKSANVGQQATIYVITPTYSRYVQKAELIRLSHTLMLVDNVHWIIVEDSNKPTDLVERFVHKLSQQNKFQNSITHLHEQTPAKFKLKPGEPRWKYPKGVWQRNKALDWIYDNKNTLDLNGIVYFADDDNTYHLELFHEMRSTRKVSVWPVGFVGGLLVERPLVVDGRVSGFNSMWESKRPFPIDMAGFSVRLEYLLSVANVSFSSNEKIGYVESHFLGQLVGSLSELEPKAVNCTKILVWHTQSKAPALHEERKLSKPSFEGLEW